MGIYLGIPLWKKKLYSLLKKNSFRRNLQRNVSKLEGKFCLKGFYEAISLGSITLKFSLDGISRRNRFWFIYGALKNKTEKHSRRRLRKNIYRWNVHFLKNRRGKINEKFCSETLSIKYEILRIPFVRFPLVNSSWKILRINSSGNDLKRNLWTNFHKTLHGEIFGRDSYGDIYKVVFLSKKSPFELFWSLTY